MLVQRQEKGLSAPALDNRPRILPWLEHILEAFHTLSNEREIDGMSGVPRPIKFSEVAAYTEKLQIHGLEFWDFFRLVKSLDAKFMDYKIKEREARDRKSKKSGRGKK